MDILHIVFVSLLALAVAGLVVSFKAKKHAVEVAVHKWAARIATAFSKAGASSTVVTPFQDLACDDIDGAEGSGLILAQYLEHPENWGKELINMVMVGLADAVLGPKLRATFSDALAGAPKAKLQADVDDVIDASPLSDIDRANAALKDSVDQITHSALHPELAAHIDNLPDGQKFLAGLLVAGKAAAAVAAPTPPTSTDPAPAAMPIPSGATVTVQHP